MHLKLKEAAEQADLEVIIETKFKMESLTEKYPQLKSRDVNSIELVGAEDKAEMSILSAYPNIFKTASLWGIEEGTILLEIKSSNIPTRTFWDKCAVNLEGASLCSSHLAAGCIRRMCTSVNNLSSA